MEIATNTDYSELKKDVIQREFKDRRRRDRKYIFAHAAFLIVSSTMFFWRRVDQSYEPSLLWGLMFFAGFVGLVSLNIILVRALMDHIRTKKRLEFLNNLV